MGPLVRPASLNKLPKVLKSLPFFAYSVVKFKIAWESNFYYSSGLSSVIHANKSDSLKSPVESLFY